MYSVLDRDLGTPCKFLLKNLTPFLRDHVERRLVFTQVLNLEVTSFIKSFKWKAIILNVRNNKLEEL